MADTPDSFPRSDAARQVAGDMFAEMSEAEQEFLRDVAHKLITDHKRDKPMEFESYRLDLEETLAIWWLLPSHIRSAIKREQLTIRNLIKLARLD